MRGGIILLLSLFAAACAGPQKAQGSKAEPRAWLLGRERLLSSPEVLKASEQIAAAADGDGLPGASGLAGELFESRDAKVRWAALARLEERSRAVLPRIRSRAQLLDARARAMGAKDGLSLFAGPDARARLERACREQVEGTAGDWQRALELLRRRTDGRPTVADFAAELLAEGEEAGAFFSARRLPELSRSALRRMGLAFPEGVDVRGELPGGGLGLARGYFRALGRALYAQRARAVDLPGGGGGGEAVAELLAMIPWSLPWLREQLPQVSTVDLERLTRSARASEALAVRLDCLTARLEVEAAEGGDLQARWGPMYEETFGMIPPVGPTWILLSPEYLSRPFHAISRVRAREDRDAFLRGLGVTPLLSPEAGRQLQRTLLDPG